ncbi:MAG: DUF882 domain-containing protein, partial [Pseudomonadota bacterium]|nr:DUF882 domain-containing protein [Pseudomonadota bacterium]
GLLGKSAFDCARRTLLTSVCLFAAALALTAPAGAGEQRTLSLYNIHTKETVTVTYKKDGKYDSAALKQINHIMRDWRRDEPTDMDPELVDIIWQLHTELGSREPVHLVSAYRSATTNEKLRRAGGGQAKFSQHILGKAADIHFPDVDVKVLRNSALVMEAGGVGYYPKSGLPFVHVDTGNVRHWPRIPAQELASIMREGRTQMAAAKRPAPAKEVQVAAADEQKLDSLIDKAVANKEIGRKVVMASFVPDRMPWQKPKADPEITSSLPKEQRPAAMASGLQEKRPAAPAPQAAPPVPAEPKQAELTDEQIEDLEHPEELSHEPFLFRVVASPDIAAYEAIAVLAPPAFDDPAGLMQEPALRLAGSFGVDKSVPALAVAQAHLSSPQTRLLASAPEQSRQAGLAGGFASAGAAPSSGMGFAGR